MKTLLFMLTVLLFAIPALAQPVTMKAGERKQLAVTGRTAGAPANWISSDPRVATVINSADPKLNGTVIAHKTGTATVTGTANGTQTPIAVTVTP